jgi:hypothetical protein
MATYKRATVSIFNGHDSAYFPMSSFTLWDAAVTFSHSNRSLALYGQNVFDKRAVLGGAPGAINGVSAFFLVNRPRTIGLRSAINVLRPSS